MRLLVVGGALASLAAGVGAVFAPALALAALAVAVAVLVFAWRPKLVLYATVIAAFTTVPDFVPMSFAVGGLQVRLYEPLIVASVIVSVVKYPSSRQINLRVAAIALLLTVWVLFGIANENPVARAITDIRLFIYLLLAFWVASRLPRPDLVSFLRVLPAILFVSAGSTLLASMFGFGLAGMQTDLTGGSDEASRLISPATYPSIVVLSAVVALVIAGRATLSSTWVYWLPALILVFLSFTRNSLISIGVAALFALFALRSARSIVRIVAYAVGAVVVAAVVYVFVSGYRSTPAVGWVAAQIDAFSSRVLDGISGEAIAEDGSAQFRFEQENAYLIPEIFRSPFVGHGFGYAYKPIFTGRFITDKSEDLQYYAHNFYLWLLVKTGIIGLLLFAFSIVSPILILLRRRESGAIACGSAGAGMLAACVVVPMPLGSPTALLLGVLAGLCANFAFAPSETESLARKVPNFRTQSRLQDHA